MSRKGIRVMQMLRRQHEENVVYIENSRLENARDQSERKELLASGTQWADQSMGEILIDLGRLEQQKI